MIPEYIRTMLTSFIQTMPSKIGRRHEKEKGMNPAYSDIEHVALCQGEKRIWVLRADEDMTLALGIKNRYQNIGTDNCPNFLI